jgi:predicted acylesterase/phospholipase RssA
VSPRGGRTAFILAGGGSRGAYQAGCLRRLDEEGIRPDLLIGSSIGVPNSLVYATAGAEGLWELWSEAFSLPYIVTPSLRRNALFGNSFFSMNGLQRLVESRVDFGRCFHSDIELTYVLANLSTGHEELRGNRTETDVDRFRTVTRIGYTIPLLHPLIELDGDLYSDGGFLWNVPFEYAVEDWGADEIYILSALPSDLPRAESLRSLPRVAMRMYDLLCRTVGHSSYLQKRLEGGQWRGTEVTVLAPSAETGAFDPIGMLNAHPSKSKRLLWRGYRDTDAVVRGGAARSKPAKAAVARAPAGGGGAQKSVGGGGRVNGSSGERRPRSARS